MRSVLSLAIALALLLSGPSAAADGSAENERLRVTVDINETVAQGSTFELVIDFENLSDKTIRVHSEVCMQTPFGMICGPIPSAKKIEAGQGVQVAALMLCETGTPPGDYNVLVVVRSGKHTLTIPHTITVVEGSGRPG